MIWLNFENIFKRSRMFIKWSLTSWSYFMKCSHFFFFLKMKDNAKTFQIPYFYIHSWVVRVLNRLFDSLLLVSISFVWLDIVGSMSNFSILRGDASKARVLECVEKLCAYRNYEMDPRHNLIQHIKHLEVMRRQVIHWWQLMQGGEYVSFNEHSS